MYTKYEFDSDINIVLVNCTKVRLEVHTWLWTYNDRQIQSVTSKFCGHYCVCLLRSSGVDMCNIESSFDTGFNDVLVHALICNCFN